MRDIDSRMCPNYSGSKAQKHYQGRNQMADSSKELRWIRILLTIIAIPVVVIIFRTLKSIFIPLVFAVFLSFVFAPLNKFLRKKNVHISLVMAIMLVIIVLLMVSSTMLLTAAIIESEERCLACVLYLLEENESNGHTKMNLADLRKEVLKTTPECLDKFVHCIKDDSIYYDKKTMDVALTKTYNLEKYIAKQIKYGLSVNRKWDIDYTKYTESGGNKQIGRAHV